MLEDSLSFYLFVVIILTDVFSLCYQTKASSANKLLIRQSNLWGEATCLKMAIAADARLFFSHDGVQVCRHAGSHCFFLNKVSFS